MKHITLEIPEKKYHFFMELIRQLGIKVSGEVDIPEEHKAIVRERAKTAKPEDMIPWDDARGQFTFKEKS